MPVYAVDVANKTICVFNAASIQEAKSHVLGPDGISEEWMVLESEGGPIWDGEENLVVREANPFEYNRWQTSRTRARERGEDVDDDEVVHLRYLIPVVDPTDDH